MQDCSCKRGSGERGHYDLLQGYAIDAELDSGSMARVFRGYDTDSGEEVAVKVMHEPWNEWRREAFRHGARILRGIRHPNIARVHDFGEALFEGRVTPFAVLEYVPGESLQSMINRRGRVSEREALTFGADIATALAHAHARGIMHRDVKPSNVLIGNRNEVAVLTDFSVERDLGTVIALEHPFGSGQARYASPEHIQQGVSVGPASDVYSLGASLYRILTGRAPFDGDPLQISYKHLLRRPVPLGNITRVSRRLDDIVMRSLRKAPHQRPGAAELATVLIYELCRKLRSAGNR